MDNQFSDVEAPVAKKVTPQEEVAIRETRIINQALAIIQSRWRKTGVKINTPWAASDLATLYLGAREDEAFLAIFLNNAHRLIKAKVMFTGTHNGCSVYVRDIVKASLKLNAAAIIIAHNHPTGIEKPSNSDRRLTKQIQNALQLVDVKLLDHLIVGKFSTYSFSKEGDLL